ncbi:MAG: hypothetical protein RL748_4205 [Pseudomonadota bacterium]|jgi:hypothetical protein
MNTLPTTNELSNDFVDAHDKWMHAQIEQALFEADDPNTVWLSNEEVKARSAARRAQLCERANIHHDLLR